MVVNCSQFLNFKLMGKFEGDFGTNYCNVKSVKFRRGSVGLNLLIKPICIPGFFSILRPACPVNNWLVPFVTVSLYKQIKLQEQVNMYLSGNDR